MASTARSVARSVAIALAAVFLSAGAALARPPITTTHFTAFDVCSGDRISQLGAKGFVEDVETCVMSPFANGLGPGTYSIFVEGVDGWFSDYDYFNTKPTNPTCDQPFSRQVGICVREAVSGTIVVTDGGDGSFIWNVTTFY
jgi:hypothetical protein